MNSYVTRLPKLTKAVRRKHCLTQDQLAELMGVKRPTIAFIERGEILKKKTAAKHVQRLQKIDAMLTERYSIVYDPPQTEAPEEESMGFSVSDGFFIAVLLATIGLFILGAM